MPKIITAHRREDEHQKAREYVRRHVLLPSSLLGLVLMVAGMAAMLYQFFAISYDWRTFLETFGLLVLGAVVGWSQTRYHQYLLRCFPGHFAGRLRVFSQEPRKRPRKEVPVARIDHPGRALIPLAYLAGGAVLFVAAGLSSVFGHTYYVAAFLLPWMGFFWAKVYFWRGLLLETR